MGNNISFVEQNFIDWCHEISPDISPYIFIDRYNRYTKRYPPLIREVLRNIYSEIHENEPNISFSLKGRYKAKRSFFIKTFITMSQNIETIFSPSTDEKDRNLAIEKYFSFLKKKNINNSLDYISNFDEAKNLILQITSNPENKSVIGNFNKFFSKLSEDNQQRLTLILGRTEDTFAYRPVVNSVDFDISSIQYSNDGNLEILDKEGNKIPISLAHPLNPDEDIITHSNGLKYVVINGQKQKLNERNLQYDPSVSSKNRQLENAQKDENGNITLLGDSIILPKTNECLDISSITFNTSKNAFFITDTNGESRNLSKLLADGNLKLRKYDEKTIIDSVYKINDIIENYYSHNNFRTIKCRSKDYIASPKPITEYMSLHKSALNKEDLYTLESQIRSLKMEDEAKDESTIRGHDAYKIAKFQKYKDNEILSKILSDDETAFDSSTLTLIKVLENPQVDLSDILGKYLMITTTEKGIITDYSPDDDIIFEHIFESTYFPAELKSQLKFDYSSYKNFMHSRDSFKKPTERKSSEIFEDD